MGCAGSSPVAPVAGGAGRAAADALNAAGDAGRAAASVVGLAAVGTALYDLGKVVPFVAPVALALGAVAHACKEASRLKADCRAFGVVAGELEGTLVKAKASLEGHKETLEEMQDVLEEAAAYIKALQRSNKLKRIASAAFSRGQLRDCRNRLLMLMGAISTAMTARLAELREIEFAEEKRLIEYVDSQGGLEAILADDARREELDSLLSNSDKLALALADDAKADRAEMLATMEKRLEEQRVMMAASEERQMLMIKQNEVLQAQVAQLSAVLEASSMRMQQFFERFPLPVAEPERLLAVRRLGLEGTKDLKEAIPEHDAFVKRLLARPGVADVVKGLVFSVVFEHTLIHFCMAMTDGPGSSNYAFCRKPLYVARKSTPCQYITADGGVVCMTNEQCNVMKQSWFGESAEALFSAAPEAGAAHMAMMEVPEVQLMMGVMMGKMTPDEAMQAARDGGHDTEALTFYIQMFCPDLSDPCTFVGCPITIDGHDVGVICVFVKVPEGQDIDTFDGRPGAEAAGMAGFAAESAAILRQWGRRALAKEGSRPPEPAASASASSSMSASGRRR